MRPVLLALAIVTAGLQLPLLPGRAEAHRAARPASSTKPKLSLVVPSAAQTLTAVKVVVRTAPRATVHLRMHFAGQTHRAVLFTGARGWARLFYGIPFSAQPGTASIRARTTVRGHRLSATRTIQVEPFVPDVRIDHIATLQQTASGWVPVTEVHAETVIRLEAFYAVRELAGYWAPPCVSGTVQLQNGSDLLVTVPRQCPASQPANSLPYVYADVPLTGGVGIGSLTAQFDLSSDEGMYGVARGQATASLPVVP